LASADQPTGLLASDRPANFVDPALDDSVRPLPPIEPFDGSAPAAQDQTPQTPGGPGMGYGMGGRGAPGYSVLWFPGAAVKGTDDRWAMVGQDFRFMAPMRQDGPNILMLSGGVSQRLIDTDVLMPDSRAAYPDNLWNVTLGLMYMRTLSEGRMFSCGVNIGSASDRPFGSINEMNVSTMAMYRRPSGPRNAWTFGVMYSPTGEIQFPIPMVSYFWNPSDQFQANLGVPFMATYRPSDRWTFEASYMPIHTINARALYKLSDRLRLVGGYSWSNEAYSLYDRTNDNDRFFLYDQRVSLGIETRLNSWLTADLTGGYAFGRYSYVGAQWDSTQYDRVDIANGPFMILSAGLRR
jgi:hypothetical protein